MCGRTMRTIFRTKNLHGTLRRLMKVGGFFVLLVRDPNNPMSNQKCYRTPAYPVPPLMLRQRTAKSPPPQPRSLVITTII
jgi:hypothetical protein